MIKTMDKKAKNRERYCKTLKVSVCFPVVIDAKGAFDNSPGCTLTRGVYDDNDVDINGDWWLSDANCGCMGSDFKGY